MAISEIVIVGIIGPLISALIAGGISWIVARHQIKSLKDDYDKQLKAYERSIDTIIATSTDNLKKMYNSSSDNLKTMYAIVEKQEKRVLDLEEKIVGLISISKNTDSRKLDLIERDLKMKQNKENLRILTGLGKALGILS